MFYELFDKFELWFIENTKLGVVSFFTMFGVCWMIGYAQGQKVMSQTLENIKHIIEDRNMEMQYKLTIISKFIKRSK